jgi:hypothetical protein
VAFGSDGGPAAKSLKPKFNLFVRQASTNIGMAALHIDVWIYFSGCFLPSSTSSFLVVSHKYPFCHTMPSQTSKKEVLL